MYFFFHLLVVLVMDPIYLEITIRQGKIYLDVSGCI